LIASGELERLAIALARHSERAILLSDMESGRLSCMRIGGPLLFGRLWDRLEIPQVLGELLARRSFEFPVERAVFASVLHRLFVSGSDRACEKWLVDYAIPGIDGLQLHHFYRAMAWLGEELEPMSEGALAPRCVKDLIEEHLFERRRDLFSDLSLVFMDTTSLSFYGEGGETLGAHGHSKDNRPELKQMVLAVVIDGDGRPICTEMVPGNTADVTVLLPVVDRLRQRFGVGRVCVVADRGMISAATIASLEERKLEYILGVRERSSALVRGVVLEDSRPFTPPTQNLPVIHRRRACSPMSAGSYRASCRPSAHGCRPHLQKSIQGNKKAKPSCVLSLWSGLKPLPPAEHATRQDRQIHAGIVLAPDLRGF